MTVKDTGIPSTRRASLFFTLRARLILTFLIVALIPIGLLAAISTLNTQRALTDDANQALLSAARQTANTIDAFLRPHIYAINEKAQTAAIVDYVSLPAEEQAGSAQEGQALKEIARYQDEDYLLNSYILAYLILDRQGRTLLDTSTQTPDQSTRFLALDQADPQRFQLLLSANLPYASSVIFSTSQNQPVFYFVTKIVNASREITGFLLAKYDASLLQALIDQSATLAGERSYATLYDDNYLILANGLSPEYTYKMVTPPNSDQMRKLLIRSRLPASQPHQLALGIPDLEQGLQKLGTDSPVFRAHGPGENPVVIAGAVVSLENAPWLVTYMTPEADFLAPLQRQTQNIAIIAILIAAGTLVIGVYISRRLTRPIATLTQVAEKVTGGDLQARAPVSGDEIGLLANAFNTMTAELGNTLEGLEQRVIERTAELASVSEQMKNRANQLQTVAEVARAIADLQDTEELLSQIAHLISDRFGFYHVGIFLLDENRENAILRAANSAGGQHMLEREHRLKVGQVGIVGYVTGKGEPRIALDVGEDAVYFDNPDLPATRSEMALPLKAGERVIGALDVQSSVADAFRQEDLSVLSTLADQVAIAIENNRLYNETRAALAELQALHSQYLSQSWAQEAAERQKVGYSLAHGKLAPMDHSQLPSELEAVRDAEPVLLSSNPGEATYSCELLAPINIRGQTIGLLNLSERETGFEWTDDEVNLVKNIVDQIGLALENARLIEQTQRRAEREHLVAEITSKLRSSNDAQVILETARREIQQALKVRKAEFILPTTIAPAKENLASSVHGGKGDTAEEQREMRAEPGGEA